MSCCFELYSSREVGWGEFAVSVPGWWLSVEGFGVLELKALAVEVDAVLGEHPVGEVHLGQDSGRELSIAGGTVLVWSMGSIMYGSW